MFPFNWNAFPFTKLNAVNLDWMMTKFKELTDKTDSVDAAVVAANDAADRAEEAASTITGAVLYDQPQTLTSPEQQQARDNIGAADAADITPDAVVYDHVQTLGTAQRAQARDNIGAASSADAAGAVKYTAQTLTATQKSQARQNIGAAAAAENINAVLYDQVQQLSETEKATARGNIDAASSADIPATPVLYGEEQTLSAGQQQQARENIDAASSADIPATPVLYGEEQTLSAGQQQQARENIGAEKLLTASAQTRGRLGTADSGNVTIVSNDIYYEKLSDRFLVIRSKFITTSTANTAFVCPVLDNNQNQIYVKNDTGASITVTSIGIRFSTTVTSGSSYSFAASTVSQFALKDAYYIIESDGALTVHSYANSSGYGYNWIPEIILEL